MVLLTAEHGQPVEKVRSSPPTDFQHILETQKNLQFKIPDRGNFLKRETNLSNNRIA